MSTGINLKNSLLNEIIITQLAVEAKLKWLNATKVQGPDGIPPKVLKELSKEISVPLCILFNKFLETGIIHNDWKSAEVVALFKKGRRSEPSNYRPVSLTSVICKMLESLIRDVLVGCMTNNKLFSTCQHGFRQQRSCITQLLEVMEDLTIKMDEKLPIDIIYLDFRKAFDSVPHARLLSKLNLFEWAIVIGLQIQQV